MSKENKLYLEFVGNIPVMRYCAYDSHLDVLERTPPKTKPGEFLAIGLSGDMSHDDLVRISSYCAGWPDRTFLIKSKNPDTLLEHYWPDNVIFLGRHGGKNE